MLGRGNGWLVWMGLAHSQKHPLSAVTVRIQDLTGQEEAKGPFLLFLDLGVWWAPGMLLVDLRAGPRPLSLHSRTCNRQRFPVGACTS